MPTVAIAAGLAIATGVLLPSPTFLTTAAVGVEDTAGRLHADALWSASELAVSRPVLLRAAARLLETKAMVPAPGLLERLGILATVDSAGNQAARLADQLHAVLRIGPGVTGALDLSAEATQPAQAARIATTVAEAFVAQRDIMLADARSAGETATTSRLSALRNAAAAAHRRLTSLAGTDVDLAQERAIATDQVAAAEARVTTLRSIIASGSPPLADSKDVPQSVEALQTAYLDLTRKLAVASETLGDRHTTIIALQDGVRRASASLTAEWKRLLRVADADLAAGRQRETSIGKIDAAPDAAHQAAIDEARRVARNADDAMARAENQGALAVDEQPYHLIAPALVPVLPTAGWSLFARLVWSALAGMAALGLAGLVFVRLGARPIGSTAGAGEDAGATFEPTFDASRPAAGQEAAAAEPFSSNPLDSEPLAADTRADVSSFFDPEPEPFVAKDDPMPLISPPIIQDAELTPELRDAFGEIVDDLVMISPDAGVVPTMMVAGNEIANGTMAVALNIADIAIERGMRVLLVEGPRQRPELAGVAGPNCEPMLADLFGSLRVVLQAEHADALFVAPYLKNGTNIAAALARNTQAPFLEDLATEFDIIIVDGARAADSAAAGLTADHYIRVGRFASLRETERFLKVLDVPLEAFVGTVAGSTFIPRPPERDVWRPAAPQTVEIPQPTTAPIGTRVQPHGAPVATRPAYPRRVASR